MHTTFRMAIQVCVLILAMAVPGLAGSAVQSDPAPSAPVTRGSLDKVPAAVFPQLKFEFDPVFEGTEIKHDFVVENKGEAPLVIKNIRPD